MDKTFSEWKPCHPDRSPAQRGEAKDPRLQAPGAPATGGQVDPSGRMLQDDRTRISIRACYVNNFSLLNDLIFSID